MFEKVPNKKHSKPRPFTFQVVLLAFAEVTLWGVFRDINRGSTEEAPEAGRLFLGELCTPGRGLNYCKSKEILNTAGD